LNYNLFVELGRTVDTGLQIQLRYPFDDVWDNKEHCVCFFITFHNFVVGDYVFGVYVFVCAQNNSKCSSWIWMLK